MLRKDVHKKLEPANFDEETIQVFTTRPPTTVIWPLEIECSKTLKYKNTMMFDQYQILYLLLLKHILMVGGVMHSMSSRNVWLSLTHTHAPTCTCARARTYTHTHTHKVLDCRDEQLFWKGYNQKRLQCTKTIKNGVTTSARKSYEAMSPNLYVRRRDCKKHIDASLQPSVEDSDSSIMVWDAFQATA